MATVLPAWKQALIEKKKKRKEDEERKKAEEENARNTTIPEWKRSLIHKRKVTSEEGNQKKDLLTSNAFVSQVTRKGASADDRGEQHLGLQHRLRKNEKSQENAEIVIDTRRKKGDASKTNGHDLDQSKHLQHESNHIIMDFREVDENSETGTDTKSSNVDYEHVRRPSIVRQLFESSSTQNFEGKRVVSGQKHSSPTSGVRESKAGNPREGDTAGPLVSTQDTPEQSQSFSLWEKHDRCHTETETKDKSVYRNNADQSSVAPLEVKHKDAAVNEEEILPQRGSVKSLRSIFSSASVRQRKTSADELINSVGKDVMTKRPPSPRKRWSADVGSLLSSQTTDDVFLEQHSDSTTPPMAQRGRSMSLCDIREDSNEEYFRHKPKVGSGLEKRFNKLIRQVSLSEGEMEIDDQVADEDSVIHLDKAPKEKANLHQAEQHKKASRPEQSTLSGHHRSKDVIQNVQIIEKIESNDKKPGACAEDEEHKASKRSVHKLSALFGASIWRGAKKADKSKLDSKTGHEQTKSVHIFNRESPVKSKQQKDDRTSNIFPWLKNQAVSKSDSKISNSKIHSERTNRQNEPIPVINNLDHSGHTVSSLQQAQEEEKHTHTDNLLNKRTKPKDMTGPLKTTATEERSDDRKIQIVLVGESNAVVNNKDVRTEEATGVPISAIDMPEPGPEDVSVSVIDVPSPGISVSVIDFPQLSNGPTTDNSNTPSQSSYLMSDELSDDSSEDGIEGSYNVTSLDEKDSDEDGDEDEDEDEDDIPVSSIDTPQFPVPIVVFETEPENVKSCIRLKNWRKKVRFCVASICSISINK